METIIMFGYTVEFISGLGANMCAANEEKGVIECDPSMKETILLYPGIVWHEIGHLTDPAASWKNLLRPGMTMLDAQCACFKAHCSSKAMSFEVAADKKAVEMGEGHSLLEGLKMFYKKLGAAAGADIQDRITRLEVWEITGEFIEDGREDLPSNDELLGTIGIMGLIAIRDASRNALIAAGYDPDAPAK